MIRVCVRFDRANVKEQAHADTAVLVTQGDLVVISELQFRTFAVKGQRLPWDYYKKAKYDAETLATIQEM